jgi:hypothetical protein
VQTLFEYLEGGDTLENFLEGFPTVPRDLAIQTLEVFLSRTNSGVRLARYSF